MFLNCSSFILYYCYDLLFELLTSLELLVQNSVTLRVILSYTLVVVLINCIYFSNVTSTYYIEMK